MHIFVNALAASAGGGLTYVRNVVPHLSETGVQATFLINANLRQNLGEWNNIHFMVNQDCDSVPQRFRYEQITIPHLIRQYQADVLLSTGNFALRRSPVSQILLSRNAL